MTGGGRVSVKAWVIRPKGYRSPYKAPLDTRDVCIGPLPYAGDFALEHLRDRHLSEVTQQHYLLTIKVGETR